MRMSIYVGEAGAGDVKPVAPEVLLGARILVTRSRKQSSVLSRQLRDLGADVVELPTIDIQPCEDYSILDGAISNLHCYQWVTFTSVNAIEFFMLRLKVAGRDPRVLSSTKIAVIGKETAAVLSSYGLEHDLMPDRYTAESVAEAFGTQGLARGCKILLPTSEIARDALPSALAGMGAGVDCVPAYRNVIPTYDAGYLEQLFSLPFDLVTFTSSSTVINLVQLVRENGLGDKLGELKAVSIGPATSRSARELNVPVVAEAGSHTIPGLVETVVLYLQARLPVNPYIV